MEVFKISEALLLTKFGYIFYNNDDNNIYRFDNNQLAIISNDIVEWLIKAKPNNVRFANDIRIIVYLLNLIMIYLEKMKMIVLSLKNVI